MTRNDADAIRDRVRREIHSEIWKRRAELFSHPIEDVADLLPIDLGVVSSRILNLTVFESEEINPEDPFSVTAGSETAGFLDRGLGIVELSKKFPHACKRYTWAHELGHFVLHPDARQYRDVPLIGSEIEIRGQPPKEREANIFASELLMPARPVRHLFLLAQQSPIHAESANEDLAHFLSRGTGRLVTVSELRQKGTKARRYRSRLLAETRNARGHDVHPLWKIFDVSPEAMAIRLEELSLVF